MKHTHRLVPLVAALMLGGCASVPPDAGNNPEDPYEGFNRNIHAFNVALDDAVLKPVTKGYRYVVPEIAREGVSNAYNNMGEVNNALNNVLQGKVNKGVTSAFRFLVNSTFGVFGIFDVASRIGMERAPEDFGQTLGVWGVGDGPYIELPFFGPSGARDLFMWPVRAVVSPMNYVLTDEWGWTAGYASGEIINGRSQMMDAGLDDLRANVVDEYVAVRDAYRQSRRMAVLDGQVEAEEQLKTLTPLSFDDEDDNNDASVVKTEKDK